MTEHQNDRPAIVAKVATATARPAIKAKAMSAAPGKA